MTLTVDQLVVADPADAWTAAGFSVDPDAVCRVGGVRIRLVGRDTQTGVVGWSLRGLPSGGAFDDLDGIPTTRSSAVAAAPAVHANGVTAIDHVVLLSPDLHRTVESLAAVGVEPRREREGELGGRPIRQMFFRFGDVIIEAVGSPGAASEGRRRSGESPTSSPTSTRPPRSSETTRHRSRTRCSPGAGSPRCGITSSGCRSGRR
jgi:hypothetical protein